VRIYIIFIHSFIRLRERRGKEEGGRGCVNQTRWRGNLSILQFNSVHVQKKKEREREKGKEKEEKGGESRSHLISSHLSIHLSIHPSIHPTDN